MNWNTSMLLRCGLATSLVLWFAPGVAAQTNRVSAPPPMPTASGLRSPVESFRTLLVMPAAERKAQLATRPVDVQKKLTEKIREYQALTPEERELRLKATELRWYLQPLMTAAPTNRAIQLALIPESLREMVAERITQWDKFPPVAQRMLLTNQVGTSYLVSGSATNLPPGPPLPGLHGQSRLRDRFNQLFELTPAEKEKVLATLSEAERRQMEKTLAAFATLTPPQRQRCIASFAKFSSLSPEDQQEFLKNAGRWAQMSATERQSWRELVSTVPKVPPLPPMPRRTPPLPPNSSKPAGDFSTNGG